MENNNLRRKKIILFLACILLAAILIIAAPFFYKTFLFKEKQMPDTNLGSAAGQKSGPQERSSSCRADSFYEQQAMSLDYKIRADHVSVSGCISVSRGTPCLKEKTLDLYLDSGQFYLPSGKEQSVGVKLEKIENNKAYFLFSYGAAPPACETVGSCNYSCEFMKE